AADRVDLLGDAGGRSPLGALEEEVLEEVGDPGLLGSLVARPVLDPDADRHRAERGQLFGDDPDAVGEARGAHYRAASCSPDSFSASLRDRRILPDLSTSRTLTSITSPSRTTSVTWRTRSLASCEMCTSPSVPGMISTNAPKSTTRRTVPR